MCFYDLVKYGRSLAYYDAPDYETCQDIFDQTFQRFCNPFSVDFYQKPPPITSPDSHYPRQVVLVDRHLDKR